MRAVCQRVHWAEVEVAGEIVGRIGAGLLVYIGVGRGDRTVHAEKLAEKVAGLRIFADDDDKLNRSVQDVGGDVLVIPNFTLMADARKGRRPAFSDAHGGHEAHRLFQAFCSAMECAELTVATGVFGAHMDIRSAADGPVNLLLEIPPPDAR